MSTIADRISEIRSQFPALSKTVNGKTAVYLDGPAGTQVPHRVIEGIAEYLSNSNANHGGLFATSYESDRKLDDAHQAAADFLGTAEPNCVSFGPNMTTLTFALSRSLARTWKSGDEIIVTRLEHDANFTPWILAARDAGVTVNYVDIDANDCTLKLEQFEQFLNDRTKLVAVGCASNATGTVNPVAKICRWARDVGAHSFLDAVHYAPHDLIDVEEFGCDFLICSAYKFFGPHIGIQYGKRELLESLEAYKLRPADDSLPSKWMTGTQNHECLHGTTQAIDYLADLGRNESNQPEDRRAALRAAYKLIREYEDELANHLLDELEKINGLKIWGITDPANRSNRLPTVSITHDRASPEGIAKRLSDDAIFVWHGNYYALPLTERLGVEPDGMVRIGLVHYNTHDEIDRLIAVLRSM